MRRFSFLKSSVWSQFLPILLQILFSNQGEAPVRDQADSD